nr:large ribosomal subunit protein uL29m-like [Pocillopora verrucosa]
MAAVLHNLRCCAFRPLIVEELQIRSCLRGLRTSPCAFGLEEFFPPEVFKKGELAKEKVHTGRKWHAGELRGKSNEDLHKLWYVLLKERNMLMTLKHEAKRQSFPMPSPTRTHKVQKSMAAIKQVLSEREKAVKSLENEVWPFDAIPEVKPPTAMEEAKAEFSDKKKDYRDLVRILKQGIKVAQ